MSTIYDGMRELRHRIHEVSKEQSSWTEPWLHDAMPRLSCGNESPLLGHSPAPCCETLAPCCERASDLDRKLVWVLDPRTKRATQCR